MLATLIFLSTLVSAVQTDPPAAKTPNATPERVKSPEEIAIELNKAEQDYQDALNMFIPWYTGPLITGSANNVPMGHVNLQPYLYFTLNYAHFNNHRGSHSMPTLYVMNPLLVFQVGLTKWIDFTIIPQALLKWQSGHTAINFGDTSMQLGFQIMKSDRHRPSVRFVLGETVPTGSYQQLSSWKEGIDAMGGGICATSVGLNLAKVFYWASKHPLDVRLTTNYVIPDYHAPVQGFNAYGGGYGTDGRVSVGGTFNIDLGLEVSITQKWVFSTDLAYTLSNKTTFSGDPGVTKTGEIATVGGPSSDQLSIAPAIEYNVSPDGGFIGGVWLPITGRNSNNFFSFILSYTQLF